jgi:predicted RNA-binding protein YlxR (DUF448 family)
MAGRPVLRRCVACRTLRDRRELWRVVRQAEGGVVLDQGMGRSAYLCPQLSCLEEARKRRRLQRALRCALEQRSSTPHTPLRQDGFWPHRAGGLVCPGTAWRSGGPDHWRSE